ncbi:Endosomal sorting complex assembly [Glarea lozoyensis ATCC 20868]|uniref:Vacuolar protein sorting-associated protein 28 n=2 Tax=Glarea lozoyensis TaxID=101852 RepID=S3DTT1_GLAL2|nr:Endosomal sorting complex assembly [Glarea lozoyensis ATCC 20868]EHL03517.1 putative Vacuolar protein sorting-associated protein 28 [Glarea lozoyensis 74030]EPE29778.1 Endosomal sorting complex assembly [Glarea lozoyensis ATCC 20868]
MYNARQAYAPTPHSYIPNTTLSATINLDEEVKLTGTRAERDLQDSLAEVFSIVITLDEIEKAYLKDAIPEADYTEICDRLLKQYRAILTDEAVARAFVDLETFKASWDMEVPRATERIRIGMPSTVTAPSHNATATNSSGTNGPLIVEAAQDFITFLDALKLGLLAKDQLHPLLTDVIQSVNKVTDGDFEHRGKIVQWLITLNQMRASEELTEDQSRELELDMNAAYQGFKATLT